MAETWVRNDSMVIYFLQPLATNNNIIGYLPFSYRIFAPSPHNIMLTQTLLPAGHWRSGTHFMGTKNCRRVPVGIAVAQFGRRYVCLIEATLC